jgi:hypothetical protein
LVIVANKSEGFTSQSTSTSQPTTSFVKPAGHFLPNNYDNAANDNQNISGKISGKKSSKVVEEEQGEEAEEEEEKEEDDEEEE